MVVYLGLDIGKMVSDDALAADMSQQEGMDELAGLFNEFPETDNGMGLPGLDGLDNLELPDGLSFDEGDLFNPEAEDTGGNGGKKSKDDIISEELYNAVIKGFGELKEVLFSIETRTGDDFGEYSTNLLKTGTGLSLSSILLWFIQIGLGRGDYWGKPFSVLSTGMLLAGVGFIALGLSAMSMRTPSESEEEQEEFGDDIQDLDDTQELAEYEPYVEQLESALDSYCENEVEEVVDEEPTNKIEVYQTDEPREEIDYDRIVDGISSKLGLTGKGVDGVIRRGTLCDLFMPMFRPNTKGFKDTHDMDSNSRDFMCLDLFARRAIASAAKKEVEELDKKIKVLEAKESLFAYIFTMPRLKGLNKESVIEEEIIRYFTPKAEDTGMIRCDGKSDGVAIPQAKVTVTADTYNIIVTKGEKSLVTYGDVFSLPDIQSFFRDEKNIFPVVLGTSEIGMPIVIDTKNNESILLAGLARSGKSWGVLNILLSLILFNTPSDVQILVIDPKDTNLFATIGCFPHIIGVHNHHNILNLLDEVINKEAEYRRRLIKENGCENIWDLRKKGILLPMLYIFIDEFSTVTKSLGDTGAKEFNSKLKVILTQFPSLGIRLIIIAHRPVGDIDKTVRVLFQHRCVFRASVESVKEVMDVDKGSVWNTPLTQAGEAALKLQSMQNVIFMRGLSVTTSDDENKEVILACAKMYYKLGVKADYSPELGLCNNRDENKIKKRLGIE